MNAQTPIGPYVRPAIPDDAEGIATVHVKSWQEAYVGMLPQEVLDRQSVPARYRTWSAYLSKPSDHRWIFVAIDPGAGIVGFAEATRHKPAMHRPVFEIPVIYILQSHARRGLGRRLMHALATAMEDQGPGEIALWSLANNGPARAFYEAIGGRLIATRAEPERGGRNLLAGYRWRSAAELAQATAPKTAA
ncbi:MAG TPA: GNAT family N-acetyltransferase [Dongiaceae bacterium]|nr:GNAT family N-acetyltransferase [Dongiaceae bacterium]